MKLCARLGLCYGMQWSAPGVKGVKRLEQSWLPNFGLYGQHPGVETVDELSQNGVTTWPEACLIVHYMGGVPQSMMAIGTFHVDEVSAQRRKRGFALLPRVEMDWAIPEAALRKPVPLRPHYKGVQARKQTRLEFGKRIIWGPPPPKKKKKGVKHFIPGT